MLRFALPFLLLAPIAVAQTPAAQQDAQTLHMDVQLVTVDVVVTDKNGKPVHGLQQGDFTVQENKSAQPLKGFEEHTANSTAARPEAKPPAGVFNNTPATRGATVDVLLLDGLNTPPQSQPYLRDQLVKFLATEQPGRQVAVFALNHRLGMLQDFTTDPELLKKVVKLQGVQFSPLLNRELNNSAVHEQSETLSDMAAANASLAPTLLALQSTLLDLEAVQQAQQTRSRALNTMDALRQLARYLAGVPGRKNLVWFSGSFPIFIQRDIQTTGDPWAGMTNVSSDFERTVSLLAQNQVAVYPVDARGVDVPPSMIPDQDGFTGNLQRTRQVYGTTSSTPRDDQFWNDQASEHATMNELADGTGGHAFYNTNALATAMQQAITDGENYYTLQYTPPSGSKPGQFRNLTVKLNKPGLRLAYRKGYYAAAAEQVSPDAIAKSLSEAMASDHGDSSEIGIHIAPIEATATDPAKTIGFKATGNAPHDTYSLRMSVELKDLRFTPGDDGKMHGTLMFATVLYARDGKVIDSRQDRATLALDAQRYRMMLTGGMRYHVEVSSPATPETSVRVAVQDAETGRIGSMHLRAEQVRAAAAIAAR